jgi:hypothetical protein
MMSEMRGKADVSEYKRETLAYKSVAGQQRKFAWLIPMSGDGWSESFAAVSLADRLGHHRTFYWRLLLRLMRSKVGGSLDWSRDPV